MTTALARRSSEPPPRQPHGVKVDKCDFDFLKANYRRLFEHAATGEKDGRPFHHPHPDSLTTKESLIRQIGNWQIVHADPENGADCSTCNGPMDLTLAKEGIIPEQCIFCGDGEIEYPDGTKNRPKKTDAEAEREDDEDEDEDEEIEEDAAPAEPPESKSAKRKEPKVKEAESKKQKVVKVKRASKAPAAAKPPKDEADEVEVVDPKTQNLLDVVEKVRALTSHGVGAFNASMWESGKLLAELKKSKLWQKHPSAFETWKQFVAGCWGALFTEKIAESAIDFYLLNKEGPPKLGEGAKFPRLPAKANPKPRGEREVDTSDVDIKNDPNFVSFAGSFKRKQKLAMLTEKGKPAKAVKDRPFAVLKAENGVELKLALTQNPKGELVLQATFSRE